MRRKSVFGGGLVAALLLSAGVAWGALPPGGTFGDDDGTTHEGNIEAIAAAGITKGCNPPGNDVYCPEDPVTRGQMAAFIVRAMDYTDDGGGDLFVDTSDSSFESDIDKMATAAVTKGCNPPANDRFCPDDLVTRGQMAAFLVRAMGYTDDGGGDLFIDDDGSSFESDIDKMATAGVTKGCNPPANDQFCPNDLVARGQMASFLSRALGLTPIVPPPPTTTTSTTTTIGKPSSPGDSKNCGDFSTWRQAQNWFEHYYPHYGDIARLDGDNDGIACESLPGAP
jgi:Excalibur calcium-binding domain/S-layer homology domain